MTLGKRKERDGDEGGGGASGSYGSTLFVSNLPYTATSIDLQTLFSDIAPVRSAFVVTEHGTGISKGVGYVSFSMKEDAESAHAKFSKEGILLAGRKLRVDWTDYKFKHKRKDGGENKKESKPTPVSHAPVQKVPHDPAAIRTIVLAGLPQSLDAKQLWKKVRKYQGAEKVEWPHKAEDGSEDSSVAHVLFSTPAAANNAVTKLHAHVFKGSLLSVTLKKRLENLSKPVSTTIIKSKSKDNALQVSPSHASRLIVRNLPFNITEQDLRALFLPYGPIYNTHIPTVQVKSENSPSEKPRAKGFAFVWMLSRKDAERALEGCNGKSVRAGFAEDMVLGKQKKKRQRRLEKKMKDGGGEKAKDEEEDKDDENKVSERVIAVDWALSKEKWEGERAKAEEAVKTGSASEVEEDSDVDESEDEANIGVHPGDGEDTTYSDDEDEDEGEEPVKPSLPATDVQTTIFIRNIPFTATEDELRTLFRAFGPLRYARITVDPDTGRSRGTGFACFWNKEDADKAIDQSGLLRKETTGTAPVPPKKNPFVLPSILTPDPSSSLAQSLVLHGRTLDVVRAVARDEALKLEEEGRKTRQKADKRNIYLLKEGVVLPNSPLAQGLAPADLERRTNSYNARRALLKSNPFLFVSRTRLSVRQIPMFVTERVLRRLALHAIHAFEAEVKEGKRTGLDPDELVDPPSLAQGKEEDHQEKQPRKRLTSRRTPGVKQAKVVRQQERIDAITGKGRSKGYGFIEMHKHADSLRVLRWANCNPGIGPFLEQCYKEEMEGLLKVEKSKGEKERDDARIKRIREEIENGPGKKGRGGLIVEFSIENVQVVQRRSKRQEEAKVATDAAEEKKRKAPSVSPMKSKKEVEDTSPPNKKRKLLKGDAGATKKEENPKSGKSIGSIIGRKRKAKKKSRT